MSLIFWRPCAGKSDSPSSESPSTDETVAVPSSGSDSNRESEPTKAEGLPTQLPDNVASILDYCRRVDS